VIAAALLCACAHVPLDAVEKVAAVRSELDEIGKFLGAESTDLVIRALCHLPQTADKCDAAVAARDAAGLLLKGAYGAAAVAEDTGIALDALDVVLQRLRVAVRAFAVIVEESRAHAEDLASGQDDLGPVVPVRESNGVAHPAAGG